MPTKKNNTLIPNRTGPYGCWTSKCRLLHIVSTCCVMRGEISSHSHILKDAVGCPTCALVDLPIFVSFGESPNGFKPFLSSQIDV